MRGMAAPPVTTKSSTPWGVLILLAVLWAIVDGDSATPRNLPSRACGIEDRLLTWLCVRALPRGSRVLGCGQEVLVARSCLEVELRRRNGGVPRIPRRVRSCLHGGPDHPAHGARLAPPLWRDQILPATTHDSTATNHHDDKSVLGLAHDHNDSSV